MELTDRDRRLLAALQDGLPFHPQPYAELGARIGLSEQEVIARIRGLIRRDVIKRFGVVVRHHELGFKANAMLVWDVPNGQVAETGRLLRGFPEVSLCYRRPRRLPDWPYNLFCMIHGRDRAHVLTIIERLCTHPALADISYKVLFSRRRFKQRGACYLAAEDAKPPAFVNAQAVGE